MDDRGDNDCYKLRALDNHSLSLDDRESSFLVTLSFSESTMLPFTIPTHAG